MGFIAIVVVIKKTIKDFCADIMKRLLKFLCRQHYMPYIFLHYNLKLPSTTSYLFITVLSYHPLPHIFL
jgi:hypothetical protein